MQRSSITSIISLGRLGLRPSEMMEVMEDREVWRLNLELLPPQPSFPSYYTQKRALKKEEEGFSAIQYFLDYPYLVYPAFDYPSIGSDNNLWYN